MCDAPSAEELRRRWVNREPGIKVTYCTDVEGHWHYFVNFVDLSNGLSFAERGDHRDCTTTPELVLQDGWHFVYGGDTCDKGPGTLRFLQAVVALKKKHPDRVHLLLGNRDINKMRWTAELHQAELDRLSPETPGAYWVNERQRKTPWAYTKSFAAAAENVPEEMVTAEMVRKYNTKSVRMRYHLTHDMGSDGEFEFRREELAVMSQRPCFEEVSDEEVVESYEESVREGGIMREYIRNAELACILGDTLLVHGQLIGNQFANIPGEPWSVTQVPRSDISGAVAPPAELSRTVDDIEDWVVELNTWCAEQVREWEAAPHWHTPPTAPTPEAWFGRGGSELICYGTPSTRVPSVVYCRWLEGDCMPKAYPRELSKYLADQGVLRVVVGHTPHGNCPTVIPNDDVYVVMADTSYSNMRSNLAYQGDNRGDAVCDVTISGRGCSVKGRTGVQTFSQVIDYRVPPRGDGDPRIGAIQPHVYEGAPSSSSSGKREPRYFIKAKLASLADSQDPRYLLCNVDGFTNTYQEVSMSWIDSEFYKGCSLPFSRTRTISLTSHGEDFGHSFSGYDGEVIKHIFRRLDRDGDGIVTRSELLSACTEEYVRQALAWTYPNISLQEAFAHLDADKDGRITRDEFRLAVIRCQPSLALTSLGKRQPSGMSWTSSRRSHDSSRNSRPSLDEGRLDTLKESGSLRTIISVDDRDCQTPPSGGGEEDCGASPSAASEIWVDDAGLGGRGESMQTLASVASAASAASAASVGSARGRGRRRGRRGSASKTNGTSVGSSGQAGRGGYP